MSGTKHSVNYKEALDDCGRLKKGWKFENGNVVKSERQKVTVLAKAKEKRGRTPEGVLPRSQRRGSIKPLSNNKDTKNSTNTKKELKQPDIAQTNIPVLPGELLPEVKSK